MRAISRARLGCAVLAAALVATAFTAGAPDAVATTDLAAAAATTVTFTTPGQHVYTVPDGVTRVDVVAVGGEGAASGAHGGLGGRIAATLDVIPGQTLYGVVGTSAAGSTPGQNGGGAAGGPGGVCAHPPGAGGGATDVRAIALGEQGSDESRILVAGGGGGAGSLGAGVDFEFFEAYGGHRGLGGGNSSLGGHGASAGAGGEGVPGNAATDGTGTTGGRGVTGTAGLGSACGGGGGGGFGGGGAGDTTTADGRGGGGGGGGSLVPGGFPAGMASHGDHPSVSFSTPGMPAPAGPLAITTVSTLKQSSQGGDGGVPFTNCPASCGWTDGNTSSANPGTLFGDIGYASTQRWGAAGLRDPDYTQTFVSIRPGPAAALADLGKPFLLMNFAHYNNPIRGDSPTALGLQTLLTVQPPTGLPAVFHLRGDHTIPLDFIETDNGLNGAPCDPRQQSATPCDDIWTLHPYTAATSAGGVTWHFELLGWRDGQETFDHTLATEENRVTQRDIYAKVTVDTNATTSTLTVDKTSGTPALTLTTTPVPQTGGTVSFTDGGDPIAGCTDVPVDAIDGTTTCTPAGLTPGAHTLGGGFSGGIGYAASAASPIAYSDLQSQTVSFDAPAGLTYGDADVALGANASSGLPVTYSSSTPAVCTTTGAGALQVLAAGDCTVTAAQAGDSAYEPAEQARTFSIGRATLTVTADDQSRSIGDANPPLTATTTGFVHGDPASVVSGTPSLSTTATAASPAGDYPISVAVAGLSAANYDFAGVDGTLTVSSDPTTTTTLTATPVPAQLNKAVTLTATVAPSVPGGAAPTGPVAFFLDGSATPLASAPVVAGKASALVLVPGGSHTVVAAYGGDGTYEPSTSTPPTPVAVTCTRTISGRYRGSLAVTSGTTCVLPGARIDGSVLVAFGASLDLEGASVGGGVVAVSPGALRICGSSAGSITVGGATGFVLIGDPGHGCASNTITGWIIALGNSRGLVVDQNTVGGAVLALANQGSGPLPGQGKPIVSGNHR